MKFYPYTLELIHPFGISTNTRTTTPVVLVEIKHDDITGYGEASLPPYLKETQDSVISFLRKVDLSGYSSMDDYKATIESLEKIETGNYAAKAAVDIALHDLYGKFHNRSISAMLNPQNNVMSLTSFTIGIDTEEVLKQKISEADEYKILKIKLGKGDDKKVIDLIRRFTDKPLYVDINRGWMDVDYAVSLSNWLFEKGVVLIEQPFPVEMVDETKKLTKESPVPVIADEAVQRSADISKLHDVYSGINIKLMKSGGLLEAQKMIQAAKEYDMKIMIGCMTETSCAVTAASALACFTDFADLDGNLLIKNDPFTGVKVYNGKLIMPGFPGIVQRKRNKQEL